LTTFSKCFLRSLRNVSNSFLLNEPYSLPAKLEDTSFGTLLSGLYKFSVMYSPLFKV
jgi:hypothetical protein